MPDQTLRVFAVEGRMLPRLDPTGRGNLMRNGALFVGRDAKGAPLPDGEEIPALPDYARALQRGDLALSPAEG